MTWWASKKSTQLFSVAPKPNDFDNKKKFFTTPSGTKKDINKLIIEELKMVNDVNE